MPENGYLAIQRLPENAREDLLDDLVEKILVEAQDRDVRPVETWYSVADGRAITFVEAVDEDMVKAVWRAAGHDDVEVVPALRVFSELVGEARERTPVTRRP